MEVKPAGARARIRAVELNQRRTAPTRLRRAVNRQRRLNITEIGSHIDGLQTAAADIEIDGVRARAVDNGVGNRAAQSAIVRRRSAGRNVRVVRPVDDIGRGICRRK